MDIAELFKIADKKLADFQGTQPHEVMDWIRHNLMDMWFNRDMESQKQKMADDVTRAIVNLFCIARMLDIDVEATLASEHMNKCPEKSQDKPKAEAEKPRPEAQEQKKEQTTEEKKPPAAPTETKKAETPPAEKKEEAKSDDKPTDKQARLAMYERALREAKTDADARKIWTQDIGKDQALTGKDKFPLCQIYEEVRKAFKK